MCKEIFDEEINSLVNSLFKKTQKKIQPLINDYYKKGTNFYPSCRT